MPPSPPSRRSALVTLLAALAAGALQEALLRGARIGLGWAVFALLFACATLLVHRRRFALPALAVAAGAVTLAGAVAWYASDWALVVAFPGSVALLALLPVVAARGMTAGTLDDLPRALVDDARALPAAVRTAAAVPRAAFALRGRGVAAPLFRGFLLGVPVVALFVVLLSADHAFSTTVSRAVHGTFGVVESVLLAILAGAALLIVHALSGRHAPAAAAAPALAATPYRVAAVPGAPEPAPTARQRPAVLRPLTWGVVLAQLVAVFVVFAAVNLRDLFGGDALVRARGTPTYAAYLHAGFAQLSVAALLAVAMVVFGHALLRPRDPAARALPVPGGRALAALEATLLALASITLFSCFERLRIYEDAYGYTYLRLGVAIFQAGVLGLLVLTLVKACARSWRGWGSGALALAFGLLVGAGLCDADRWVARGNLARAESGRPLDFVYLASLGPDAREALDHPIVQNDWGGTEMLMESWDAKGQELRGEDWRSRRGLRAAR